MSNEDKAARTQYWLTQHIIGAVNEGGAEALDGAAEWTPELLKRYMEQAVECGSFPGLDDCGETFNSVLTCALRWAVERLDWATVLEDLKTLQAEGHDADTLNYAE